MEKIASRGRAAVALKIDERKPGRIPQFVGEVAPELEPLAHNRAAWQRFVFGFLRPLGAERLAAFLALDAWQLAVLLCLREHRLAMRALELNRHAHVLRLGREMRK